jgi:hypothetical protein
MVMTALAAASTPGTESPLDPATPPNAPARFDLPPYAGPVGNGVTVNTDSMTARASEPVRIVDSVDAYVQAPRLCPLDSDLFAVETVGVAGHRGWIADAGSGLLSPLGEPATEGLYDGQVAWRPVQDPDQPVWYLFVRASRDEGGRLLVGSPDLDEPRSLVSSTGVITHPRWTPDGRSVAYVEARADGARLRLVEDVHQWLAAFAAGEVVADPLVRDLSSGPIPWVAYPEFSPDGRWICITAWGPDQDSGADLWLVHRSGTVAPHRWTSIPGHETRPTWSRDGRWLAFHHLPPDGSGPTLVASRVVEGPEAVPRLAEAMRVAEDVIAEEDRGPVFWEDGLLVVRYVGANRVVEHVGLHGGRTRLGVGIRMPTGIDADAAGGAVITGLLDNRYGAVRAELGRIR